MKKSATNKVKSLFDWSGNNYHFMQTVESNQPTYDENENGLVFTGYEFMALPQEKPTEKQCL